LSPNKIYLKFKRIYSLQSLQVYSILTVFELENGEILLKMRNPSIEHKFKGEYASDND
jgi:hypothetical protein